MKYRNKIIAAIATATTLAIAAPLLAQAEPMGGFGGGFGNCDPAMAGRHNGMRGGHEGMMGGRHHGMMDGERMLRGLDLTEEQRDKIFELRHEQAPQLRSKWKEVRSAHRALRELAWSGDYSDDKAQQLAGQAAQAMADIETMRAKLEAGIYGVLDDAQRATMNERREMMQQRRMEGGPFGAAGRSAPLPEQG